MTSVANLGFRMETRTDETPALRLQLGVGVRALRSTFARRPWWWAALRRWCLCDRRNMVAPSENGTLGRRSSSLRRSLRRGVRRASTLASNSLLTVSFWSARLSRRRDAPTSLAFGPAPLKGRKIRSDRVRFAGKWITVNQFRQLQVPPPFPSQLLDRLPIYYYYFFTELRPV